MRIRNKNDTRAHTHTQTKHFYANKSDSLIFSNLNSWSFNRSNGWRKNRFNMDAEKQVLACSSDGWGRAEEKRSGLTVCCTARFVAFWFGFGFAKFHQCTLNTQFEPSKLLLCWRCGFLKCHENKRTIPKFSIHPHTIHNDKFTAWMKISQARTQWSSV